MNTPSVSLIIPTFNRAKYLRATVESLLTQTYPILEMIIVDDGSTDATPELVPQLPGNPLYLRKENGGRASSINHGVRHAKGDLIWVFDDDDIARPDSLALLIAPFLKPGAQVDFTYGPWYLCDENPDGSLKVAGTSASPLLSGADFFHEMLYRCFTQGNAMLIARRCYDAIGPMREDLIRSQDHDYMLRLGRHFNATPLSEPIFYWRRHQGPRGAGGGKMFGAKHLVRNWHLYRQKIFVDLHRDFALVDYLPPTRRSLMPGIEREARLRRAVVMSAHGLWNLAFLDMQALTAASGQAPWTAGELDVFARLASAVTSDALLDLGAPEYREPLRALARHSMGWPFVQALLRAARWQVHNHLRDGERASAWRIVRAVVAAVGPWQLLRAGAAQLFR